MKPASGGILDLRRVMRAAGYSYYGFKAAWREAAFRQELALFAILAPLGAWLGQDGVERALLVGSLALVLIVELLNSAVEMTVDRIGADVHHLSGKAKDLGSAAVLAAIAIAVMTWVFILTDRG